MAKGDNGADLKTLREELALAHRKIAAMEAVIAYLEGVVRDHQMKWDALYQLLFPELDGS